MTEPDEDKLLCPICGERAEAVDETAGKGTWAQHELEEETHMWPIGGAGRRVRPGTLEGGKDE